MRKIVAFDFDGTLTTKDTLLAFIRYAKGSTGFWLGFLRYSPQLVLMKLGLYPNYKAKQKVFAHFFKGMTLEAFDALCQRFANDNRHLLRPQALEALNKAISEGAEVVIVSASIDNWVQAFFEGVRREGVRREGGLGSAACYRRDARRSIQVIGTQIEVKEGVLTGRFLTNNCYGQEKVNRIQALFPNRQDYHLTAYGDSRGDQELLAFADESHYKPFRT